MKRDEENHFLEKNDYFPSDKPVLDYIIHTKGFLSTQFFRMTVCLIIIFMFFGFEFQAFGPLVEQLKKHFTMSTFCFETILGAGYIGAAVGSISSNRFQLAFGRDRAVFGTFALNLFATALALLTTNPWIFAACRLAAGFQVGISMPICIANYLEMIPSQGRGFANVICASFTSASGLIYCWLVKAYSEHLQGQDLIFIFTICLALKFGLFILFFWCNIPSVRYLVSCGNTEEACEILKTVYGVEIEEEIRIKLMKEIQSINNASESSLSQVFSPKYLLSTICLILLWIVGCLGYAGTIYSFAETMKQIEGSNSPSSVKSAVLKDIHMFISSFMSSIVGAFLCEVKFLGRKNTILGLNLVGMLSLAFGVSHLAWFEISFNIFFFAVSLMLNTMFPYSAEVYHTSIRVEATGMLIFIGRVSGYGANYIFVELANIQFLFPYYLTIGLCFVGAIATYNLPFETNSVLIDQTIDNKSYEGEA